MFDEHVRALKSVFAVVVQKLVSTVSLACSTDIEIISFGLSSNVENRVF